MRKALVVGIDYYENINQLHGCVNDSWDVKTVLERNSDGTLNFGVNHLSASSDKDKINRKQLKDLVTELFKDDCEIALLFFAGHGHIESTGGYLITSECKDGDDGLAMNDILEIANNSPAKNKIVILDCCHSGIAGTPSAKDNKAILSEGLTILTASSATQYAQEINGSGVFTRLLVDALNGSASNLLGDVTPGSVYAHIDQSLGVWQQRPIFKTNVKSFTTLRKVQPSISIEDLKKITILFNNIGENFKLNPSYEPESPSPVKENTEQFAILQKYNRINLVVPVDAPHMYHAAMESKACKLTILGEHYWKLVKTGKI